MNMIHAKLRHIIESNSSEEGVSSCSSVAGDEIHDYGVPGSFSWFRSEEATSLDALHCVGCESLLVPQEIPLVRQDLLLCTHLHATCPLFLVWW